MTATRSETDMQIDIDRLKERYREEREKRMRSDGERQFLAVDDELEEYWTADPNSAPIMRDPLSLNTDVIVLGGGFAGLLAGANLRAQGVDNFRIVDMGSDFGGTWYWNRYPGVQCDFEAYCYLPLLEELGYVPSEKYSRGPEIFQHCRRIAKHFDLYSRALFQTRVEAMRWNEEASTWHLETDRGDDLNARFVIMASGQFNRPRLPGVPGITTFEGKSFHTCRWDFDYTGGDAHGGLTGLLDKRVGIIGTGATAIQCIPHLGQWAKELYVFQRTPSAVDARGNKITDPQWARSLEPGWAIERRENFDAIMQGRPFGDDIIQDGWTQVARNVAERTAAVDAGELTPELAGAIYEEEDFRHMERIRMRVDSVVTNPEVAEKLKAYYRWTCKRPTFHDEYLPTFNRDNVHLIDVSASKGVDRITPAGVVANGVEYPLDCLIFATGFEVSSSIERRYGIPVFEGRGGVSLYDHWRSGYKTLHGIATRNFPNFFFTGSVQGGLSFNITAMFHEQTAHAAYIIRRTLDLGAKACEVTEPAQEEWAALFRGSGDAHRAFLAECTPGYYNGDGAENFRSYYGEAYPGGFAEFCQLLEDWRQEGSMEGIEIQR